MTALAPYRVDQYLDLVRTGALPRADRVELLEGSVVAKMGKNPPHVLAGKRLFKALAASVPPGWHVAKEDPIETADSVPEPDCAVIRGSDVEYRDRLPQPADVALVVEIADASLGRDREVKKRVYARAGIPVYWLMNLIARRVEVHSEPTGPGPEPTYRNVEHLGAGGSLPLIIDGQEVARLEVDSLLP